jgi:hypothetical protein
MRKIDFTEDKHYGGGRLMEFLGFVMAIAGALGTMAGLATISILGFGYAITVASACLAWAGALLIKKTEGGESNEQTGGNRSI